METPNMIAVIVSSIAAAVIASLAIAAFASKSINKNIDRAVKQIDNNTRRQENYEKQNRDDHAVLDAKINSVTGMVQEVSILLARVEERQIAADRDKPHRPEPEN